MKKLILIIIILYILFPVTVTNICKDVKKHLPEISIVLKSPQIPNGVEYSKKERANIPVKITKHSDANVPSDLDLSYDNIYTHK